MPDIWHQFGSDLVAAADGDLATVDGTAFGQQRVLRRLLTNPGDYIWQPDYGAGLAQFIGQPVDVSAIQGRIRSQIFMEAAVARSPEPLIDVQADESGRVFAQVTYSDATTSETQVLTFSVGDS